MVWVAMVVMVLDRKWKLATVWAVIGALFALFGIIHVPKAGFKTFTDPTWEQCDQATDTCWDNATQMYFFIAYLMLGATFALIEFAKRFDDTILPEIDDETAHAFDDWFANAGVATVVEKDPDPTAKGFKEESVGESEHYIKDEENSVGESEHYIKDEENSEKGEEAEA